MSLPLEDTYEDIIEKAVRGAGLTVDEIAKRAGVDPGEAAAQLRGELSEPVARALAPVLALDATSLIAIARNAWSPDVPLVPGLHQVTTPWQTTSVNAYAAWDDNGDAALFDTGVDPAPLLEIVASHGLEVRALCVTHTHGDHIAGLPALRHAFPSACLYGSKREPLADATPLDEGDTFQVGDLRIEVRSTRGHSRGGLSYVVRGLARMVAIVGDALFAGSMGGGSVSWRDALATNRARLFTLPDATAICPGHGPMTTVGQEKAHNPFYPEFKSPDSGV